MEHWTPNQLTIERRIMSPNEVTQFLQAKKSKDLRQSIGARRASMATDATRAPVHVVHVPNNLHTDQRLGTIKIARQQDSKTKPTYMIKNQENHEEPAKKPFNTKMIAKINNQNNSSPIKSASGSSSSKSSKSPNEYEKATTAVLGEDCDLEPAEKFRCEKQPSNFNLKVVLDKVPLPSFKPASAVSAPLDPEDEIEEIEDVEEIDETDEFDESLVDDSLILNISDTSFYMKSSTVSSDDLDLPRRNMRSQNAEFSIKQQVFLNKIQSEIADVSELSEEDVDADKMSEESSNNIVEKRKRVVEKAVKPGSDPFCWRCHTDGLGIQILNCKTCVRSYHNKCLKGNQIPADAADFLCPECIEEQTADEASTTKTGKKKLDLELLKKLLEFALNRMGVTIGSGTFRADLDKTIYADIDNYIVHPVTLNSLQLKLEVNKFKTIEAFLNEVKYIHHNTIIYPNINKFKATAKSLLKICRQELMEIETCPECYFNANTIDDWFVAVCSKPHIPLWAKLKGFPYWPAKAMSTTAAGLVDVRFFGAHDRAWVPLKDCALYSEKPPNVAAKTKRHDFATCMEEVAVYTNNLSKKFGAFQFAAPRTQYDPTNEVAQLQILLPAYMGSPKIDATNNKKLMLKFVKTAGEFITVKESEEGASSSAHPPVEPDATLKTTAKAKTPAKPKNDKGKKKLLQRLLIKTVEDAVDAALNGVVDSENKDVSADESVDTMIIKRKSDGNFQRVVKPPKRPRNVMSIDRKRKRSDSESSTTRNVTVGTASSKKKFRDPNFDRETRSKSSHVRPPSSDEEDTPDAPKDIHEVLKAGNERNNVEKTLPAVRPAYEGPIDIVPVIKQEKFSDDEGEGPTPRNGARARKDSDSSKNDGPRARKTFPNNKSRNFTNPQNQNLPYQSPQCQSILNESNGMVLVPVQRATNATSTPKIMVVATRNLMGNANSAGSSRGAQAPGTSSSRIAEVPLTNGHGPSNNETPAMPQLSTIPVNSVFPNLPAPSPHIRSLYSAFHAARVAEDSRNSQSKDVLENHVAGSNINNNINNIMLSAQSHLLADFFRKMLEDFLSNMANTETPLLEAKVKTLELENERLKEDLQKTITKADNDLKEQRASMLKQQETAIFEARQQCEEVRVRSIEIALKDSNKQAWCANCGKEAQFYCCSNVSYCNEDCQSLDWRKHMTKCERTM